MDAAEVLSLLLKVNLAAGAAILVVLAMRKPVRRMFGARTAYGLWLLLPLSAVALLLPARIVFVQPAAQASVAPPYLALLGEPLPDSAPLLDPALLLTMIWLVGVVVALAVMLHLQRRFAAEAGKGAIGPAVVGVLGPRIVTPRDFESRFSPEEQALVMAHEQAHLAQHHSRINGLTALVQCVCWFNPLIHLAAHLARIDQELACDEAVVTTFPDARRTYADALVKAQLAIRPLPLGCYWPSGTEHPLLERISMLKISPIGRRRRLAGSVALAVVCVGASAGAWAARPPQVRVASPVPVRAEGIPEMRPTGVMLPAYGSYAPGTPAAAITVTTPEMTPTGALRPVFEPAAVQVELAQAPPPGPQRASLTPTGFRDWDDAEANGPSVALEGTVARVRWVNPRTLITLVDANGVETTVESQTPNALLRHGITRDVLKAGVPMRVEGYRRDDGTVLVRPSAISSQGRLLGGQGEPRQGVPPAVTDRSALTNAVIRDEPQAPPRQRSLSPRILRTPSADELRAAYPESAMRLQQTGAATLDCMIGSDGALADCSASVTGADEHGFGAAAMKLAPAFRFDPNDPNGQPISPLSVRIPIKFALN